MNTIMLLNLVVITALECALDNVKHPLFDGYEIFPERSVEIYLSRHEGIEEATFSCKMQRRGIFNHKNGVPIGFDGWCIIVEQFRLKSLRDKELGPQMWKEAFKEVVKETISLVPEAVFDTASKTWFIGDKSWKPEEMS